MPNKLFIKTLSHNFDYNPTLKQSVFFEKFAEFLFEHQHKIFLLKGYAGTGKTSLLQTIVQVLPQFNWSIVLMAPTGRAAKVMSQYTGYEASTIHRKIYFSKQNEGKMVFTMQKNKHQNTLFVIDESSMLGRQSQNEFLGNSLLDDLMQYVWSGKNCKLMLVGDTAQLPPIGQEDSDALNFDYLSQQCLIDTMQIELDEVMRQALNSGILMNATTLRELTSNGWTQDFVFNLNPYKDIVRLQYADEIIEAITQAYQNDGAEDTCVIVRSNKRANLYNQSIRNRILFRDHEIESGDLLMVVKNNYFWLQDQKNQMFIANGDVVEVMRILSYENLYDMRFARALVRLVDYELIEPFETVLLLDTLSSESPSLSYEQSQQFYKTVLKDYEDERAFYKKIKKLKENIYFNALQIKFSYAVTCHKSQGGQWQTLFVEQPYLPDGFAAEDYKWLYTAITRAQKKVYLIGFEDQYFE